MKSEHRVAVATAVFITFQIALCWSSLRRDIRAIPAATPVTVQINFSNMTDGQAKKLLEMTLKEFDKRGVLPPMNPREKNKP